jgi:SNF2-related domain/Helicase conserved C-terminal domain/Bacterial SNF2 helicase associated/SWIM zinc finger
VLTSRLASQVPQDTKNGGLQYYQKGAVTVLDGDQEFVDATVRGSRTDYDVTLERKKKSIKAWCSCPYCDGTLQPCKHIWAAVLAAEARGWLRGSAGIDPTSLAVDQRLGGDYYDDEDDWDDGGWGEETSDDRDAPAASFKHTPSFPPRGGVKRTKAARPASWKQSLKNLRDGMERDALPDRDAWPAGRQIVYILDVPQTLTGQGLTLDVSHRQVKKDGEWSKPKSQRISLKQIAKLPDADDRHILALLVGAKEQDPYYGYSYSGYASHESAPCRYRLAAATQDAVVPPMCRTCRCFLRASDDAPLQVLTWEDGPPWEFRLELVLGDSGKNYVLNGALHRGTERMPLSKPVLLVGGGLVFWDDRVARLQDFDAFAWISLLRNNGPLAVPVKQKDDLVQELLKLPRLPRLDLPEELRYEEVSVAPRPCLKVRPPEKRGWGPERLRGDLSFDYDGALVPVQEASRGVFLPDRRRFLLRDPAAEAAAAALLNQLGFKPGSYYYPQQQHQLELAPRNLPKVVRTLLAAGWNVEAEGKVYRRPGLLHIEVNSGVDWFELHGNVDFDGTSAALPALLAAVKRGDNAVKLDDGTFGLLPEEWLKKYGLLAGLGKAEGDHLRFTRSQVGLLDALLASQPEARVDAVFEQARDELRHFEGIAAADAPPGFVGELRGYQRDGLGWLHFVRKFGFGGCLADDMGLGKTIQVLALLESRRVLRADTSVPPKDRPGTSLVVVPKSLVFNWKQEATRFTPHLRVLDHTGMTRSKTAEPFAEHDVVLTTYGTLRRDALLFKDVVFDYCILDEAQAIKNAGSESAKAARLLQAHHRLALSGTPIENHLGELWSLFEFLNPGMLGSASVFQLTSGAGRNPAEETRILLARALRPFILRRTKRQVASDLPEKTEQTLYCELDAAQRQQYDELRDHYRQSLLAKVERDGINQSKIEILTALLRLRQAACHPGLIDKKRTAESSAKLDALLPQLTEVLQEGHKVLVFSQFTSLLAILRDRLDQEKIPYEYLDGRTRNRGDKVEHFQNDPDCKLFLISLKAGGLGLNLTAADYVFLLDPWWNPAVESQAIDRAHRIGQTRQVFAYRLIAKDTVEEKVLELQKTKRDLADAIINADNSLIRSLGREDLELLLS